jgi:hypothetical protein
MWWGEKSKKKGAERIHTDGNVNKQKGIRKWGNYQMV